jgi:hypothetical protein
MTKWVENSVMKIAHANEESRVCRTKAGTNETD